MNPNRSDVPTGSKAERIERFLRAWPDDPMHVEARGLLLGRPQAELIEGPLGGLVFIADHGLAVGFGAPSPDLLEELLGTARRAGFRSELVELHLPVEVGLDWATLPAAEGPVTHRIQGLETAPAELGAAMDPWVAHDVAEITSQGDGLLDSLPKALAQQFRSMDPWPTVAASLAGGCIAGIASAFVETERYFDVSIDTVRDFRREGFGTTAAAALIKAQARRGKEPVWMVRESNQASVALARKLGFEDVGLVSGMLLRVSL